MKIFGIIAFNILLGFLSVLIGSQGDSVFFSEFLKTQILPISATIIGFTISGVIFLLGHLLQLQGNFAKTRKEIRDNVYLMGMLFLIMTFLLFGKSSLLAVQFSCYYSGVVMTLFFTQFYAIYELLRAIFTLQSHNK